MADVEVAVTRGVVCGEQQDGIARFFGITYAAPPFGVNRFAPPAPVQPWDGVRAATGYGPTAPKGDHPPQYARLPAEQVIPGEDCLNLNVWAPARLAGGRPVLVWIHGGSFTNGSGSVLEYDGNAFARDGAGAHTLTPETGATVRSFPAESPGIEPSREAFQTVDHGIWVSFVTTGDPGWPAYSRSRRTVGVIAERLTAVDDPDGDERALWDGVR